MLKEAKEWLNFGDKYKPKNGSRICKYWRDSPSPYTADGGRLRKASNVLAVLVLHSFVHFSCPNHDLEFGKNAVPQGSTKGLVKSSPMIFRDIGVHSVPVRRNEAARESPAAVVRPTANADVL